MKTYSEKEKIDQAHLVLSLIIGPLLTTEQELKHFVYQLSLMNSMAAKGYRVKRDSVDNLIYAVKQLACEYIVDHFSNHCRYFYWPSDHGSVLYVYCEQRQYSFHVEIQNYTSLPRARFDEWNEIRDGWALDDESYVEAVSKQQSSGTLPLSQPIRRYERELTYYKAAKQYCHNRELRTRIESKTIEKFWGLITAILPKRIQRTKYFSERNFNECFNRHFEKIRSSFNEDELFVLTHSDLPECFGNIKKVEDNGRYRRHDEVRQKVVSLIADHIDQGTLTFKTLHWLSWTEDINSINFQYDNLTKRKLNART